MIANFETENVKFQVNLNNPLDISIPMNFDIKELKHNQPNNYNVPYAKAIPYQDGQFIGNVGMGGSCNFDIISIIPHCNGTHTECIGHITNEKQTINSILKSFHKLCLVITVNPIEVLNINNPVLEYYPFDFENIKNDRVINYDIILKSIKSIEGVSLVDLEGDSYIDFNGIKIDSLAIRTLPNNINKLNVDYMKEAPTYLTNDAVLFLNEINIQNLLLDIPSIDRQFDQGKLSSHHIFWGLERETNSIPPDKLNSNSYIKMFYYKTITEMIFIDDKINDGAYLLNLQIASFELDASPSKPVLYPITF